MPKQTLVSLNQQQFTTIYQLTQQRNLQALQVLHKNGQNFDVSIGVYTVAGQFAKEGDNDAVSFLLKHFNLDRKYIQWAYARAGLYQQAVNLDHFDATKIASGAAFRGDFDVAFQMVQFGVRWPDIIIGYASGGHQFMIELLTYHGPLPAIKDVRANIFETSYEDYRKLLPSAGFGYALENHSDLVDDLLITAKRLDREDPLPHFNRYQLTLNKAALGYAQAGLNDKAEALIALGASLDEAVTGAALHGDTEYVEELITRGAKIAAAINGYAIRWSFFNEESTLQLLAFTLSDKTRADIANAAPRYNPDLKPQELLLKAKRLRELMLNYDLTYNNAKQFLAEQKRLGLFAKQPNPVVVNEKQEFTLQFRSGK